MTALGIVLLALVLPWQFASVSEAQCTLGCKYSSAGATVPCDFVCSGAGTCSAPVGCDSCAPLDGWCTICGTDSPETINGTGGADIVCPAGGNDTIDTKGGNDFVYLGGITVSLPGGVPQAGRDGPAGNTTIFLGAGGDFVGPVFSTDSGDDIIFGEGGDDYIDPGSGRNFVDAGPGNDTIEELAAGTSTAVDDVVGSLLCGGTGNDVLYASGPAHQCMDAGPDQAPPGGTNDCTYIFAAGGRAKTSFDLGTARRCGTANVAVNGESCGCD